MKRYKTVLSIAGSDSGGGAGIQADIKAISACGCFAMTAITALTAQNTCGVVDVHVTPADNLRLQIEAVLDDIGADAVKIGMLPTAESVAIVIEMILKYKIENVVLDPVMVATSGDRLISQEAIDAIVRDLIPVVSLVTPNIPECECIAASEISSEADFIRIADTIKSLGAKNLLVKAGHLVCDYLTDYLFADKLYKYSYEKIDTRNTHGTGCTLSSSIAAFMAHGYDMPHAVTAAEKYLHEAIEAGADYSIGKGHGGVKHFYKFW